MATKFLVTVREVFERVVEVEADSSDEATRLVAWEGKGETISESTFVRELDRSMWDVEPE